MKCRSLFSGENKKIFFFCMLDLPIVITFTWEIDRKKFPGGWLVFRRKNSNKSPKITKYPNSYECLKRIVWCKKKKKKRKRYPQSYECPKTYFSAKIRNVAILMNANSA